jgi:hypothetical protein
MAVINSYDLLTNVRLGWKLRKPRASTIKVLMTVINYVLNKLERLGIDHPGLAFSGKAWI